MAKPPFPSNHPLVKNKDGSYSNVLTSTFALGPPGKIKHYVIPTMVGGKKLSGKDAVAVAKRYGLGKYPSFDTAAEALAASKRLHDKQPPPSPRREAAKNMLRRKRRGLDD